MIPKPLPKRVIMTDDPLRAKMLSAHHLEYSSHIYERDDVLIYTGSYRDIPIAVVSSGFGSSDVLSCMDLIKELDAEEVVFIGECISATSQFALRTVVLADGGDCGLLIRARETAGKQGVSAIVQAMSPPDCALPEEGCVTDGITGALYARAHAIGLKALSVLTVTEVEPTGEKMEEHERRSRLYPAANLVFETLSLF